MIHIMKLIAFALLMPLAVMGRGSEAMAQASRLTEYGVPQKSVVHIKTTGEKGGCQVDSYGHGWFIAQDTIATTWHVYEGSIRTMLTTVDGIKLEVIGAPIIVDTLNDVVLLRVDATQEGAYPPLPLDPSTANVGRQVVVAGHPNQHSVDRITAVKQLPIRKHGWQSARLVHLVCLEKYRSAGESGKPAIASRGVVGMVRGRAVDPNPECRTLCISNDVLLSLLQKARESK